MGLSFRKGVRLGGGLRLNLSKRGVGVSGGVKGARVSVGPRGAHVRVGRKGVEYRKTISGRKSGLERAGKGKPVGTASGLLVLLLIAIIFIAVTVAIANLLG